MGSTPLLMRAYNLFKGGEQNVQSSFNMLKTIDADHARVHDQLSYGFGGLVSVAPGSHYNYLLRTTNTRFHLRDFTFRSTVGPAGVRLFEGAGVDVNSLGTAETFHNMNRGVSVDSADVSMYSQPHLVVSSYGTQIDFDFLEQSAGGPIKAAGGAAGGPGIEWVLTTSQDYLISFVNSNGSAALVGVRMNGYVEG